MSEHQSTHPKRVRLSSGDKAAVFTQQADGTWSWVAKTPDGTVTNGTAPDWPYAISTVMGWDIPGSAS